MSCYLEDRLIKYRKKKIRLRSIFKTLRDMTQFSSWSDLFLLNTIVDNLNTLTLPYSKAEIYQAFKLVDKEDYYPGVKKILIAPLIKNATEGSVFTTPRYITIPPPLICETEFKTPHREETGQIKIKFPVV